MTEKNLNNQLNDEMLTEVTGGVRTSGLADSATTSDSTLNSKIIFSEGRSTETLTSNASRLAANATAANAAERLASTELLTSRETLAATETLTSTSRVI